MSMDLELQFPRIGVRIPDDRSLNRRSDPAQTGIPPEKYFSAGELGLDLDEGDLCRTPRSEENRIPQLKSPPPAPRKKAQRRPSFKRKLKTDLTQFFEIVHGSEELDEFFRSGFEFIKRNKCVIT